MNIVKYLHVIGFENSFNYKFRASCPACMVGAGFLTAVWLQDMGFHLDLGLSSF